MKIAVLSNVIKSNPVEAIHTFLASVKDSCQVFFAKELEGVIENVTFYDDRTLFSVCDVAVVFGGDGTTLCAARRVAPYNKPILSINTGHLGFLATVGAHETKKAAECLLSGQLVSSERIMLDVSVLRNGESVFFATALNDIIIKRSSSRITNIALAIDSVPAANFRADGLVISTPTGSTAYSLSCGGPLVLPHMELFVISPICPHILSSRAMVVSSENNLKISVPDCREISISADGQEEFSVTGNDEILISKAPFKTRLLTLNETNFFSLVRQKLTKD